MLYIVFSECIEKRLTSREYLRRRDRTAALPKNNYVAVSAFLAFFTLLNTDVRFYMKGFRSCCESA